MTDLEIRVACAKALGYWVEAHIQGFRAINKNGFVVGKINHGSYQQYNPLVNDAQAMELVKVLELDIYAPRPGFGWTVGTASITRVENANLNQAICECAAKIQALKGA